MTSTLPPLLQAVSGAIGSASANALTYPLDLVTTRLQLRPPSAKKTSGVIAANKILQHIVSRYGISALYDGLSTDTSATLLSNFLYFYVYSYLRNFMLRYRNAKSSLYVGNELLLGFAAGVASRAVSMPLNLITLRLQTEKQEAADDDEDVVPDSRPPATDVLSVIKLIYSERGLRGFWRGFETTILLSLNPSITLAFFQFFLRLKRSKSLKPSAQEAFVGGAISNSIAIAFLYPLILAKTRLQASNRQSSLVTVLDHASRSRTLYQGLDMQIVKGFLSQGVTFLIKERIEQAVVNMYLRRRSRMASR